MNNIKGVPTIKELTGIMNRAEALIDRYNKKYDYDMELATGREREEYNAALARWAIMKVRRDVQKYRELEKE